jgi:hypothetical protein
MRTYGRVAVLVSAFAVSLAEVNAQAQPPDSKPSVPLTARTGLRGGSLPSQPQAVSSSRPASAGANYWGPTAPPPRPSAWRRFRTALSRIGSNDDNPNAPLAASFRDPTTARYDAAASRPWMKQSR